MAGKDPITTKFNVDISDLKRGITEANQTIKRANAQFKAATAGMDDWEHSADGLEAKLKQLSDTITAGQKKVDNYRERVQRLEQAEAENTKRAEKLKAEYQQAAKQFGVNSNCLLYTSMDGKRNPRIRMGIWCWWFRMRIRWIMRCGF